MGDYLRNDFVEENLVFGLYYIIDNDDDNDFVVDGRIKGEGMLVVWLFGVFDGWEYYYLKFRMGLVLLLLVEFWFLIIR